MTEKGALLDLNDVKELEPCSISNKPLKCYLTT